MLVLHAGYDKGTIYFWGESPFEDKDGPTKKVASGKAAAKLPFAADGETVKNAIAETLYDGRVRKLDTTVVQIWVPCAGNAPLSSSPLVQAEEEKAKEYKLKPFLIDSVDIGHENTISFLSACVNRDIIKAGIVFGDDLNFWIRAVRFAGALVARQEYLPGVSANANAELIAVWEPIFLGNDAKYIKQMRQSMPGSCRAVSSDLKVKTAPTAKPGKLLSNFLISVVDHIARFSIYSQPQSTWSVTEMSTTGNFNSIHDHWLAGLVVEEDRTIEGKTKEIDILQAQILEWRRPIYASIGTPFKLLLQLEEPADTKKDGATWRVHFFLKSVRNPDVIIPAEHIWNPTEEESKVLSKDGFDAKEFLLSSLGGASRICPRIENALRTKAPTGYELDTTGSYEFLTERAVALEQAGFGVSTPEWWNGRGTHKRLGARARVNSSGSQKKGFSLHEMLKYNWELTLDGEKISSSEIKELVRSKMPLVQMRGHWIHLEEQDVETALNLEKNKAGETGSFRDIIQMALGSGRIPGNFEFEGVAANGWIQKFIDQLEGNTTFDELVPPKKFTGTLRPYQNRGFSWLHFLKQWGLGACLADDMGLGKTVQALTLIQYDWDNKVNAPVLVICPTSLTGNWHHEAERFTPELPVLVHHGVNRAKGQDFIDSVGKQALVISSYSILHRDIELFKQVNWAGVILDEAQNIKNPKTKQARSARALKSGYRIAMTGTPIENNVGDLWSIMEFLNPGLLGSQADFKRNFLQPIQANHESKAVDRLKKLTGPFILRRLKNDKTIIKDLPEKMEMKCYTTLSKEQASLYEALVAEVESNLDNSEGMQRRGLVLSTLTKLKQICNHPAHFLADKSPLANRSGKLSRLTEMLEEIIAVDERALVFTQFAEMGKLIQQHVQDEFGKEVLFLYGGVPKHKRDEMIKRFQNDEDGPHVFVLSLKAGGTGLNLMRANHVFHFDRWWNPAVEDQATDRVYRIGQTRNVQIHKFLCAGTLEERIDDMISQKKELANSVVGTGENWLTELSTSELKKLFELRAEAVSS